MKLPVIRSLTNYIEEHDKQAVLSSIEVLEHLSQSRGLSDEELDVIGELISNMCGSLEVDNMVHQGQSKSMP